MKRILLALFIFFPSLTKADFLPTGCYVAFSNPGFCYEPLFTPLVWNTTNLSAQYGLTMAIVIADGLDYLSRLAACNADFDSAIALGNSIKAERDTCNTNAAAIESNRQEWIAYGNSQAALVKKLRRKCGKSCKKIR